MAISSGFSEKSIEDILSVVTEFDLLKYYLNVTEIPCRIQATYRRDNKPSLGIYLGKNDKVQFLDFATRDAGGIFDLLCKTWNTDLRHCLNTISKDLDKICSTTEIRKIKRNSEKSIHRLTNSLIKVKIREWKSYDIDFWESFGISLSWLKFGDIVPISHIFIIKDNLTSVFPADKYAYAYIESKDDEVTFKIYQPYSDTHKWMNKHDSSVWDLWTKLPPNGDKLIITSSRKDALCIWENTGIPSVSLQGEGYLPKSHIIEELKSRFKQIFILYDNDFKSERNYGREFGKDLAERFGLIQLEIPTEYLSKDTSDLCKNHGRQAVYRVIHTLINDKLNTWEDELPF